MIGLILRNLLGGWGGAGLYGGDVSAGPVASGSASKAPNAAVGKAAEVEDRLDRLQLVCMAMWSLLKERTNLTEEDLLERVRQIDLEDGVEDGKCGGAVGVTICPNCGRKMSARHRRCLYCGQGNLPAEAFDATR